MKIKFLKNKIAVIFFMSATALSVSNIANANAQSEALKVSCIVNANAIVNKAEEAAFENLAKMLITEIQVPGCTLFDLCEKLYKETKKPGCKLGKKYVEFVKVLYTDYSKTEYAAMLTGFSLKYRTILGEIADQFTKTVTLPENNGKPQPNFKKLFYASIRNNRTRIKVA